MAFAYLTKKQVEFPDGTVTIHKLSWRSLQGARLTRAMDQAASMRNIGGEILKALRSETVEAAVNKVKEEKTDIDKRRLARYDEYDRGSLLVAGIEVWSYGELNAKAIDDLPEDMAERLHHEILDLSLPALEPEKVDAEGKEGSVLSTSY